MIAIILEEDQHSRAVLSQILTGEGGLEYRSVLATADCDEARYLIGQNKDRIKLILSDRGIVEEQDFPLARFVTEEAELEPVPFILTSNDGLPTSLERIRKHCSRIDDLLVKPFGPRQLKDSVTRAHRMRAEHRNSLLVLGLEAALHIAEAFYARRSIVHWREVVPIATSEAMTEKIRTLGFRLGGVVVDPSACDGSVIAQLSRYKKTPVGAVTPLAILSRDPDTIRRLRSHCELFFDYPDESQFGTWEDVVTRMSFRALYAWEAKEIVTKARRAIKAGDLGSARSLVRAGMYLDPDRWEFQELAGAICARQGNRLEAVEHFRAALVSNPCSPYAYLCLLDLLEGSDQAQILETGGAYCFAHPQMMAARTKVKAFGGKN